jgi:hypothetical protein
MTDLDLQLIGKVVLETREEVRKLAALPATLEQMRDDQTVMIRMLQRREAEIEPMRALEQRYASLRAKVERLEKLEHA